MNPDWRIINKNLRDYVKIGQHLNTVALNSGNSLEHELLKTEICFRLKEQGRSFMTEVVLKNGKRPDVLVLDLEPPLVYEIMHSEVEGNEIVKELSYGLRVVVVRTNRKI